jgi:enamine deaminase RidA (YjgF/YER057c/UK114 family)
MVFVAGQISVDKSGNVVGAGDLRAQTVQVLENVKAALAAAGATFADVVKQNTYVVNLTAEALPIIREVRAQYLPSSNPPASTLVGVTALAMDGLLIEVEVVAIVD